MRAFTLAESFLAGRHGLIGVTCSASNTPYVGTHSSTRVTVLNYLVLLFLSFQNAKGNSKERKER